MYVSYYFIFINIQLMSYNRPIQLGLCCINTTLRAEKPPVYCSRTMIIRTINQEGGMDTLIEKSHR